MWLGQGMALANPLAPSSPQARSGAVPTAVGLGTGTGPRGTEQAGRWVPPWGWVPHGPPWPRTQLHAGTSRPGAPLPPQQPLLHEAILSRQQSGERVTAPIAPSPPSASRSGTNKSQAAASERWMEVRGSPAARLSNAGRCRLASTSPHQGGAEILQGAGVPRRAPVLCTAPGPLQPVGERPDGAAPPAPAIPARVPAGTCQPAADRSLKLPRCRCQSGRRGRRAGCCSAAPLHCSWRCARGDSPAGERTLGRSGAGVRRGLVLTAPGGCSPRRVSAHHVQTARWRWLLRRGGCERGPGVRPGWRRHQQALAHATHVPARFPASPGHGPAPGWGGGHKHAAPNVQQKLAVH